MYKTRISYSMLNEVINCPHVYLNRINKLPRYTSGNMTKGIAAHDTINDHITGVKPQPLLADLPKFEVVEKESFDTDVKITLPIGDKYELVCYADTRMKDWSIVGEIKTGKKWTAGDFVRLNQWKVYVYANPNIKEVYLINTPFEVPDWNESNVKVYNTLVTDKDRADGLKFIEKGIKVIETMQNQELYFEGRHPFCWYESCGYCSEPIPQYRR